MTKVSEVRIIPIRAFKKDGQNDTLVALATCILDGKFFVGSIGIYDKGNGEYRITYPTKKSGFSAIKLFYPISKDEGDCIEKIIVDEYLSIYRESV